MKHESGNSIVRTLVVASASLFFAGAAQARGFDPKYTATRLDANGDGLMDIFVSRPASITILDLDGLVVPISTRDVADFVLLNNGNGSFRLGRPGPGMVGRASSQGILLGDRGVDGTVTTVRDVDKDGVLDLELSSLADDIPGAMDIIVYGQLQGKMPTLTTAITPKIQTFTVDLVGQLSDPDYVKARTVRRLAGTQVATREWFGFASNDVPIAEQYRGLNGLVEDCTDALGQVSSKFCAVSTAPPSPCVRQVDILDVNLNPVDSNLVDVCQFPNHVYIFDRLRQNYEVTLDRSAVDADAIEAFQALQVFNRLGCPGPTVNPAADGAIGRIVDKIYGSLLGRTVADRLTSNNGGGNVAHPRYPGDELFAESDRTFHHYDVDTLVCRLTEPVCAKAHIDNLLRRYSYPSRRLKANLTRVDNVQVISVFGPLGSTGNPSNYTVPGGPISQEFLPGTGYHEGAIRNRTIFPHPFFPGFISRKIFVQPDGLHVFTHGVGLNRVLSNPTLVPDFCPLLLPLAQVNPVNILLGFLNDFIGPKIFKQLDREMVKDYRRSASGGVAAQFVDVETMVVGRAQAVE